MDCWLNTLSYSTECLAPKSRVWFLWQLFPGPVYTSSCALVPLAGHCPLVLMLGWLGKPQRAGQCLSSSVWNAVSTSKDTPNWNSGFQSSLYSILHSYILSPPPLPNTPITTTCNIITLTKSCSKQLEVGVFKSYSPTQNYGL